MMRTLLQTCRLWLIVVLASVSFGFGPPTFLEADADSLGWTPEAWKALGRQAPAPYVGEAALLMDGETGLVLFERNAHARRAQASITKIMTAMIALERGRLQDQVLITWADMTAGSTMGLWPNDVLSLEALLYGLLLPSGNDAALAIAKHVAGDTDSFVSMMNERAEQLGLRDTHFANPHGLDEVGHYSSAYDVAQLARLALRNPTFSRMVATPLITVTGSRPFLLSNSNLLLHQPQLLPGIDGVKTGYTTAAGDSLVASVTRDGHRLIGVVLGAEDRHDAGYNLLTYGLNNYRWQTLPTLPAYILHYRESEWRYQVSSDSTALGALLPAWGAGRVAVQVRWEQPASGGGAPPLRGSIRYTWGDQPMLEQPLRLGP